MLLRHAVFLATVCALCGASVNTGRSPNRQQIATARILEDVGGFINWIYQKIIESLTNMTDETDIEVWSCLLAMKAYTSGIVNGSMWALSMVDSSSKIQSGLLLGNFVDLGQYDQCVRVKPDSHISFSGMHCLLDLKISLPANMTIDIDGSPESISTLLGSNILTLTMGQCFPSACKPWIIEDAYNILLYGVNKLTKDYRIEAVIDSSDCHLEERGEYSTTEWVVLIFVLFTVFLASLCTTADLFSLKDKIRDRQPYPGEQMLLSFSVNYNWNKLMSTTQSEGSINCLQGLKVISICWVVLGHRYRYLINQPLQNLMFVPDQIKNWTKMFILSAPLSVDTFFMISGLLNMYAFCSVRTKTRRYNILDVLFSYIHRYIRLTPSYAMMIAITATWLYRTGNGPMWDRLVSPESAQCRISWWKNIIYINNYFDRYCMMQSWYLAADMQMFWLSPLVVYPLWRWPWFGYIEIAILSIASIASPFAVSYFDEIKAPIPLTTNTTAGAIEMDELYLPTHTKTISYVIGILTGYLLHQFKAKKIPFKINMIFSSILWILTGVSMLYAVFGGYQLFQLSYVYDRVLSAFYIGFYRFFWSIGLMWIIIACAMDYAGPINNFLSWSAFAPLGRLTYCIYLTHIAVILYGIGSMRSPTYYRDYTEVQEFFGDLFITIVCSVILSLLLEAPLMTLEKLILGGSRGDRERRRRVRIDPEAGPSGVANINGGERLNY